jgi:hypothetical protein
VRLAAVGLGLQHSAARFAQMLNFPTDRLYFDPEGATHKALQWSAGYGQGVSISAFTEKLPMLMASSFAYALGIGSPGTVQEVGPSFTPRQHLHVVSRGAVASFPIYGLVS